MSGGLDIFRVGSDVVFKYFDYISVKEMMKLCRVNRQFNIVCQKDSMWRRKVKNDYGVKTKYGKTWKDTAQFLFEYNMINLNQKWVNEKTYKELFDESLKSESDTYFKDLYDEYHLITIIFPSYVKDIITAKESVLSFKDSLIRWNPYIPISEESENEAYEEINEDYDNILEDENRLKKQAIGMTREFSVIALASSEIRGTYSNNSFGLSSAAEEILCYADCSEKTGEMEYGDLKIKIKKLTRIVDPNLYIMTYSVMPLYNLWFLDVWSKRQY
uniref:F-box-like protein n=1 Tax=Pithovirus LCPAC404 TaxID=2506597 RepID=A0A481ZCF0_9VIRU|nr:MAG: F-box-like protein [Pithovirus LCPAC404]